MVRHFAGNVCHMAEGFMDKNNDTLSPDFEVRARHTFCPVRRTSSSGEGAAHPCAGGGFTILGSTSLAWIHTICRAGCVEGLHAVVPRCLPARHTSLTHAVFLPLTRPSRAALVLRRRYRVARTRWSR